MNKAIIKKTIGKYFINRDGNEVDVFESFSEEMTEVAINYKSQGNENFTSELIRLLFKYNMLNIEISDEPGIIMKGEMIKGSQTD